MKYRTMRCPHCKKHLEVMHANYGGYDTPFRICSYCGGEYIDEEYVELAAETPSYITKKCIRFALTLGLLCGVVLFIPFSIQVAPHPSEDKPLYTAYLFFVILLIVVIFLFKRHTLNKTIVDSPVMKESMRRFEDSGYKAKYERFKTIPSDSYYYTLIQDSTYMKELHMNHQTILAEQLFNSVKGELEKNVDIFESYILTEMTKDDYSACKNQNYDIDSLISQAKEQFRKRVNKNTELLFHKDNRVYEEQKDYIKKHYRGETDAYPPHLLLESWFWAEEKTIIDDSYLVRIEDEEQALTEKAAKKTIDRAITLMKNNSMLAEDDAQHERDLGPSGKNAVDDISIGLNIEKDSFKEESLVSPKEGVSKKEQKLQKKLEKEKLKRQQKKGDYKVFKRSSRIILGSVVGVLILALGGLNIYQYYQHQMETEELQKEISSLNQQSVDNVQDEGSLLSQEKADWFDRIDSAATGQQLGWSSNQFHASEGFIVMSPSDSARSIQLTCDYGDTVNVSTTIIGDSAGVTFDEDTWEGATTTISISPYTKGITVVTFTSSIGNESFKVIIVVR